MFDRTPYLADLQPGGRYLAKDLDEIGGVPVLMKVLLDGGYLHGDCMTVTGKSIAENLAHVVVPGGQDIVRSLAKPLSERGGIVGLKGDSVPVTGFGLVPPPHARLHMAQIVVRQGVVRLAAQGIAVTG